MTILGFNFTKINVERKEAMKGKLNIKNNVTIKDIKEVDLPVGKDKQKALKFIFEFSSEYEPQVGSILLGGDLMLMEETKKINSIMAEWKKEQKVDKDIMTPLLNTVLTKCNIQALILSQHVNLPPPIPLPKVDVSAKQEA
ncbi:MAG: hypothetical protein QF824_02610 [Candidatus Woesearchaeota archaeon]|jgi:hypothetical protein|nr:hypothetical protein [Candidatus Woesearchaeota archaeon]